MCIGAGSKGLAAQEERAEGSERCGPRGGNGTFDNCHPDDSARRRFARSAVEEGRRPIFH